MEILWARLVPWSSACVRTIPPLLKTWAEEERDHGGVIFIDEKTISPADIGGQVGALSNLVREAAKWDWTNRVCFLQPSLRISTRHLASTPYPSRNLPPSHLPNPTPTSSR